MGGKYLKTSNWTILSKQMRPLSTATILVFGILEISLSASKQNHWFICLIKSHITTKIIMNMKEKQLPREAREAFRRSELTQSE
jgi:hypothetical protein